MKKIFFAVVVGGLAGCAVPMGGNINHQMVAKFDARATAAAIAEGAGRIEGTAFLRQQGGGVVTCAGSDVVLIPATDYSLERLRVLYGFAFVPGAVLGRDARVGLHQSVVFTPDPPEYRSLVRATRCDAQGEFVFDNIKDGEYLVVTQVVWRVQTVQGGTLATRVAVENGRAGRAIMTK